MFSYIYAFPLGADYGLGITRRPPGSITMSSGNWSRITLSSSLTDVSTVWASAVCFYLTGGTFGGNDRAPQLQAFVDCAYLYLPLLRIVGLFRGFQFPRSIHGIGHSRLAQQPHQFLIARQNSGLWKFGGGFIIYFANFCHVMLMSCCFAPRFYFRGDALELIFTHLFIFRFSYSG